MKTNKLTLCNIIKRTFPELIRVSPKMFIISIFINVLDGILFALSIVFMQKFFDEIMGFSSANKQISTVIFALIILFIVKVMGQIINGVDGYLSEDCHLRTVEALSHKINIKISRLGAINFENTEILDDIEKSYEGIKYARRFFNTILSLLTFYIPYYLLIGLYLFYMKPQLAFILLWMFLPVLFTQIIRTRVYSELEGKLSSLRRRERHYKDCLTDRKYLKETRSLGATSYFLKLFKETIQSINEFRWKADLKMNLIEFFTKLLSLIGYMGILWMLFISLMNREITIGVFAAMLASIDNMFQMMEEIICDRLPYCAENFGKINNYLNFMDLPERYKEEGVTKKRSIGDIVLDNVSFSYPNVNKNAIDGINLTINEGKTLAIVGENGSGKSTLVKLIAGIYEPTCGVLYHNNIDIMQCENREIFFGVSAVFQNFQKYQLSIRDNIVISDFQRQYSNNDFDKLLQDIDLSIEDWEFTDGFDTILSMEFGGMDLSGGQWQKIAIGRGLFREHELIILDEPTASIDPIEESNLYESFSKLSKGKTSILVTHRLGSVKIADEIIVMDKGSIVGKGTHESLLRSCTLYKKMWLSQSKYYI